LCFSGHRNVVAADRDGLDVISNDSELGPRPAHRPACGSI
jgi:hypothetical protein